MSPTPQSPPPNSAAPTAREEILARIRRSTSGHARPAAEVDAVSRDYLTAHVHDGLIDLLAENLADYRAKVHRCTRAEIPGVVAKLLSEQGDRSVAVPDGLPEAWLEELRAPEAGVTLVPDSAALTATDLDAVDAVVSGCALAIAETGTIVLDAGPGQGRRMLTLVPDHHICVVRCPEQVVASVPQAMPLLDPGRPQTWIAGPSATSDIELDRVEGVHGPRRLDVILIEGEAG
ncbi:LutC/YkgG family protein [Actinospica robiniae]|uniref:LutC/YkgG family protein n=1 Tax=Actinospica robiniae TaxID=304901 RepID=UPI000426E334|nr:lactate utilization protein C [Actinospica robiniae]